jgi:triacylglycerol lipase
MLAVEALGVALCAILLIRFGGMHAARALALSAASLLGVYFLLTLATFAVCWPRKATDNAGQKIGAFAACSMIFKEWLAFFALFAVMQPFADSLFSVKRKRLRPAEPPVLLVHGYQCNSALWWWLVARLRAAGFAAEAIDLEPAFAGIDWYADQLHRQIEACIQDTGSETVQLVTHSMGGLVARAYLKQYGSRRVGKLITLACGHHGTRIARLGLGKNAREMEPGSAWLAALEEPAPAPVVTVWAAQDNFIAPQTSGRLAGAREIMLTEIGHLTFVFSPRVLDILVKELS